MPARSRTFSELLAEDAGTSVQTDTFYSPFSRVTDQAHRLKRRKTGLNSRFDKMVQAMNVTYQSPNSSRPRSSSASSFSVPQTPVDAYNGLQVGALGEDFAILKRDALNNDLEYSKTRCTAPLPTWLSETFSTLKEKHPLRLLLPTSVRNENVTARDNSQQGDTEDPFAFKPPEALLNASNTLLSPIAFRNRIESAEHSTSAYYASLSSRFTPFTTPGPASSICPPTPPKSFLSMSSAHDAYHRSLDQSNCVSPHNNSLISITPHITSARGSSFLSSSPTRHELHRNFDDGPDSYAFAPDFSESVSAVHEFDSHNDVSADLPRSIESPCLLDAPSPGDIARHRPEDIKAFSIPGPTYITSRPVYFEAPADDPLSDSPDPAFELDYKALDFQWIPFDRKSIQTIQGKAPIQNQTKSLSPEPSSGVDSLPPSSDQLSFNDSNHSHTASHTTKSSSTSELPLPTSSDPPNQSEAVELHAGYGGHSFETAACASPSPFQFNPPSQTPSLTRTIIPSQKSSAHRRAPSQSQVALQSTNSRLPTVIKSDDLGFPLSSSGHGSTPEVKDFDVLRDDLLKALDMIAPSPDRSKVNKQSDKQSQQLAPSPRAHPAPQPFPVKMDSDTMAGDTLGGSQDSIESWSKE
ncbi:hypothetical protein GYMLUDRAFT_238751 [Collybiopsis luxurians FD-317 M1]|nr:hypothetical protein GYMLUDRAFT_238751 [Collybiopsis luxurians FD-317 M1]